MLCFVGSILLVGAVALRCRNVLKLVSILFSAVVVNEKVLAS